MIVALDSATLVYQNLASSQADGALVGGISGAEAAVVALTNPASLIQYVNADLQQALSGLAEGTRVELVISGWSLPLVGSVATSVAGKVNAAWSAGQVDYQGEAVNAWPEYPGQVAWGDDSTATVTIRTLVGQWEAVLFVFLGIFVVAAVWVLWDQWSSPGTNWSAKSAAYSTATGNNPPTVTGEVSWLVKNAWWLLPGAGVAVAAPFVIKHVAEVREEENRLHFAEGGGF